MSPNDGAPNTCRPTSCPGPNPSMKSDNWPPSEPFNEGAQLDHI